MEDFDAIVPLWMRLVVATWIVGVVGVIIVVVVWVLSRHMEIVAAVLFCIAVLLAIIFVAEKLK